MSLLSVLSGMCQMALIPPTTRPPLSPAGCYVAAYGQGERSRRREGNGKGMAASKATPRCARDAPGQQRTRRTDPASPSVRAPDPSTMARVSSSWHAFTGDGPMREDEPRAFVLPRSTGARLEIETTG